MTQTSSTRAREPAQRHQPGPVYGESPAPGSVRGNNARAATPMVADEAPTGFGKTWSLIKLLSGLALVAGISLGAAWGAHYYAMSTPRFAIEQIEVSGARRLTSENVSEQAGIRVGQNTFRLDIGAAEAKLLSNPWVKSARITRELPRGLKIDISEFEARALVSIGSSLFLVTRAGEPFKRLASDDPFDIPIITGISQDNLARDRPRELERIALGLEVLAHYERLPITNAFPPQEVHLDAAGSVTLVVGRQGVSFRLGKGAWLMKLRMAARVMSRAQRQGKVPGIIFLDNDVHQERVVVRMR